MTDNNNSLIVSIYCTKTCLVTGQTEIALKRGFYLIFSPMLEYTVSSQDPRVIMWAQ